MNLGGGGDKTLVRRFSSAALGAVAVVIRTELCVVSLKKMHLSAAPNRRLAHRDDNRPRRVNRELDPVITNTTVSCAP